MNLKKKLIVLLAMCWGLSADPYLVRAYYSSSFLKILIGSGGNCTALNPSGSSDCETALVCDDPTSDPERVGISTLVTLAQFTCPGQPASAVTNLAWNQMQGNSDEVTGAAFGIYGSNLIQEMLGSEICFGGGTPVWGIAYPAGCPGGSGRPKVILPGVGGSHEGGDCDDGSECGADGFCPDGGPCTWCQDGSECNAYGMCADGSQCGQGTGTSNGGQYGNGDGTGCDYCQQYWASDGNCDGDPDNDYCPGATECLCPDGEQSVDCCNQGYSIGNPAKVARPVRLPMPMKKKGVKK